MLDLNNRIVNSPTGFTLYDATGISDTGFITGDASDSKNQNYAFLLTPSSLPLPELSTVISFGLLLALGLSGMAIARRKRGQA